MASDPGCSSPADPHGISIGASHSQQLSADHAGRPSSGHADDLARQSPDAHVYTEHASDALQLARSGPSVELVGGELYEFELEQENDIQA